MRMDNTLVHVYTIIIIINYTQHKSLFFGLNNIPDLHNLLIGVGSTGAPGAGAPLYFFQLTSILVHLLS